MNANAAALFAVIFITALLLFCAFLMAKGHAPEVPAHVTNEEIRRLGFVVPGPPVPNVGVPAVGPSAGLTNGEIRRLGIVVPGPRGPSGCGWYDEDQTGVARLSPQPVNCNPNP